MMTTRPGLFLSFLFHYEIVLGSFSSFFFFFLLLLPPFASIREHANRYVALRSVRPSAGRPLARSVHRPAFRAVRVSPGLSLGSSVGQPFARRLEDSRTFGRFRDRSCPSPRLTVVALISYIPTRSPFFRKYFL